MDGRNVNEGINENLNRAKQVDELLGANRPEGNLFAPISKLHDGKKAEELYLAANKPEATDEEKAEWAFYAYKLHTGLNAYLADINANNPALLERNNVVANINNAYALNTYLCADALAKAGAGAIQKCINEAYEKAEAFGRYETFKNDPEKLKAYEDALAKTLYLARLKFEYENVHGTEEEQKAWRSEILTELMSDSLDTNAQAYKKSKLYKLVIDRIKFYSDDRVDTDKKYPDMPQFRTEYSLSKEIQSAFKPEGQSLYHKIYRYFAKGVKTEEEKKAVLDAVAILEEYKTVASALETDRTGKINLKDVSHSPYFDTLHIKKRAKLYGEQKSFMTEIRKKEAYDEQVQRYADTYENSDKKEWVDSGKEKELKAAQTKLEGLQGIRLVDEEIDKIDASIETVLEKEKEAENLISQVQGMIKDTKDKIAELEKENKNKKTTQKTKEFNEIAIERYKNTKTALEKQIPEMEQDLKGVRQEMENLIEEKNAQISVKSVSMELIFGRGYSEEEIDYKEEIKSTEKHINNLLKEQEKKKEKYIQRAKDTVLMLNALDSTDRILEEADAYDNYTGDHSEIEEKRDKREETYKKDHRELYHYTYLKELDKDKNIYVSKSSEEAVNSQIEAFAEYKRKKGINDDNLDREFQKSLNEYKKLEEKYAEGVKIEKPLRENLTINAFKAPAVAEFRLEDMKVREENVKRFQQKALAQVPEEEVGVNEKIIRAAELADERALMGIFRRKGSQEYQDINSDLHILKDEMASEHDSEYEKTIIIPKLRKLVIQMDDYIQRKEDEKPARENTSGNAYVRRINMTQARGYIKDALNSLMVKNNVTDYDYAYEDVKYAIENTRKLTKDTNRDVDKLYKMISDKDNGCAKEMYNYILENSSKYSKMTQNGRVYNFKLNENDPAQQKNLPKNSSERFYKTIVIGYEKIVKSNLHQLAQNDPEKLEERKFKLAHQDMDPMKKDSVDNRLGLKINPESFNASLDIEKKNSLEEYKKMFDNHYRVLMAQLQYGSYEKIMTDPENYNIQEILSEEKKNYLIESVVSSIFAGLLMDRAEKEKEKNPNYVSDFDFDKTEKERVKFLSLIKNTGLFEKMIDYTMKNSDLAPLGRDQNGDLKFYKEMIYKNFDARKNLLSTPEKFTESIVVSVISDDLQHHYEKVKNNLSAGNEFDAKTAKEDLERIDMDLQLIKACGQTKVFEKVAGNAIDKTKDLNTSIQEVKKQYRELTEQKSIAPIKAVTM